MLKFPHCAREICIWVAEKFLNFHTAISKHKWFDEFFFSCFWCIWRFGQEKNLPHIMGSLQRKADATTNQNCWIRKIKIECWCNSWKMQALVKSKYLKNFIQWLKSEQSQKWKKYLKYCETCSFCWHYTPLVLPSM